MSTAEPKARGLTYEEINDDVLGALRAPTSRYFIALVVLGAGVAAALSAWMYQVRTGMGVAGINHPVGWGLYIGNFVFWVGIAHSGTFISAILHLVRSKWRDAVSRSSEAMTIFAVMTAGLFPLIHLGRLWVFYYIIPYPSQRQLWPNFTSPLVLDLCAIGTYFTVSLIFWYVGLIPDLASARDRFEQSHGRDHWRTRLYRRLSLGWFGAASQWRHYGRSYLYFAALATPLVVSVHSVVSWDFALGILPGWHSTLFAPYFVAGAIHSGLAMVLTLMIPMRRLLKLERVIQDRHFQAVALTMLVTTCIVGYAYVIEPFKAWYSGDTFEQQFSLWRATGPVAWIYWMLIPLNVLFPLTFAFKRLRSNLKWLFIVSILVNVGMWYERYFIVTAATAHDFIPHNWGPYQPTWVELVINGGAFCWFFMWFAIFAKMFPTVPVSEMKDLLAEQQTHGHHDVLPQDPAGRLARAETGLLGIYGNAETMLEGLDAVDRSDLPQVEVFSPVKVGQVDPVLGLPHGPVRYWTLCGAVSGIIGGFSLAWGSALVNRLIVGSKPVLAWVVYVVVAFEGMVLLGAIANLAGMIFHARLGRTKLPRAYDRRFSRGKFGLWVPCAADRFQHAREIIASTNPEEIRVLD